MEEASEIRYLKVYRLNIYLLSYIHSLHPLASRRRPEGLRPEGSARPAARVE